MYSNCWLVDYVFSLTFLEILNNFQFVPSLVAAVSKVFNCGVQLQLQRFKWTWVHHNKLNNNSNRESSNNWKFKRTRPPNLPHLSCSFSSDLSPRLLERGLGETPLHEKWFTATIGNHKRSKAILAIWQAYLLNLPQNLTYHRGL